MSLLTDVRCRTWWLPKEGNSTDEYEDAVAVNPGIGRFAIADGATESAFAAIWARLLVKHFVEDELRSNNELEWLAEVRSRWLAEVNHLLLPWYAEMKREEGAAATLLGLTLSESAQPNMLRWEATVVGDSCLFHMRNGELHLAFPITSSVQFDNSPPLICSRLTETTSTSDSFERHTGEFRTGDTIILATDALAQWFLRERESGRSPWKELRVYAGGNDDELMMAASSDWMERLRASKAIRNDDVTMLVVE